MEKGISIRDTGVGIEIRLDGNIFRKIALEWEQGIVKPFYTHLKAFVMQLERDYGE